MQAGDQLPGRVAAGPENVAGAAGQGVVSRAALFARLSEAARVTVLSASAGSGKTVLLRSWIARMGLAGTAAWVSVRGEERDPRRFWISVADALRGTAAGSITDPDRQKQVLALVAEALAKAGRHEQAIAVASSITDPNLQVSAVAEALAAGGDTRQARHVAAAACAVGRWATVLGLVLSLEPSTLRALAEM